MDTPLQQAAEARKEAGRRYAQRRAEADYAVVLPRCKSRKRREACREDLPLFLRTYFPELFSLPFGADQLEGLEIAASVIREGGRSVVAAPRGDGKTHRLARACLWAILYGYRKYLVIICATESLAERLLGIIRDELQHNTLLLQDWPEVCHPIRQAKGSRQRMRRLHLEGKPLGMDWSPDSVRLPTIKSKGSAAHGQTLQSFAITSSFRGLTGPDGSRPDIVLVDDPSTDESAKSPTQTAEREGLISGAVAGLAGPLNDIAIFATVTVIRRGDLAERLLDNKLHPEYTSRRYPLVRSWSTSPRWEEYTSLWRDEGRKTAALYYSKHREEMDKDYVVSWEYRVRKGELSPQHTAFNLRLELGPQFWSEYQNEPLRSIVAGYDLCEDDILSKIAPTRVAVAPDNSTLTIAVDVNAYGLHWVSLASLPDGAASIIDYGRYPGGDLPVWQQGMGITEDQAIFGAVLALVTSLSQRPYVTVDGTRIRPSAVLVDCGYRRDTILSVCKALRSNLPSIGIIPVRGFSGRYYSPRYGLRKGDGWHVGLYGSGQALCLNVDVWRERAQRGWLLPVGAPGGSLSLYSGGDHRAIASHVLAERISDILTSERGGTVYLWTTLPGSKNDWLDSLTYALAGASYSGVSFGATVPLPQQASGQPSQAPSKTPPESKPTPPPSPLQRRPSPRRPGGWATSWR